MAIYGAAGYTAGLVAAELRRRGYDLVLVARDAGKLRRAGVGAGRAAAAKVDDRDGLAAAFAGTDVVVNCAGPFAISGEPIVRAALDAGAHYVDTAAEQLWLGRVFDELDGEAHARDRALVPGAGFYYLIGDLLVALLHDRLPSATELSVGYAVHGWRMTPGSRATAPFFSGARIAFEAGTWRTGPADFSPGEFEFPAPLGRLPVVAYPVGEVITAPRHTAARSVRGWMSFGDELPAEGANASDWERNSFTVAVTARSGGRRETASARGRHIYAISAPTVAAVVDAITTPGFGLTGALAPASVLAPGPSLEALVQSHRFDFEFRIGPGDRWS